MKRLAFAAACAAAVVAGPAPAAVIIDFNGITTTENVQFASATNVAKPTLTARTSVSNVEVMFANALGLVTGAHDASSLSNASGDLFGTTTVTIGNGFKFAAAEFNIPGIPGNPPPAEASNVFVEALGLGGDVIGSGMLKLAGNGQNRIRIVGDAGELFGGFRFTLNPTGSGVDALTQVRFSGVAAAIPEPATWAMMFAGFGIVGATLRRRRRTIVAYA